MKKRKNGKQKMNNPDEGATGTFWENLDALRDCLLKALAVTVVCALVAFFFKESLFRVVLAPKEAGFVTYRLMGDIGQFLGVEGMIPDDFSVKLINTGLANQFVVLCVRQEWQEGLSPKDHHRSPESSVLWSIWNCSPAWWDIPAGMRS